MREKFALALALVAWAWTTFCIFMFLDPTTFWQRIAGAVVSWVPGIFLASYIYQVLRKPFRSKRKP